MDSTKGRVRVSVFLAMRSYVEGFGVDFSQLLDDVGLSSDLLNDYIGVAPIEPVVSLFERAGEVLGDPCFGLHLASSVRPGGTGVLGKLVVSAPTVREALHLLVEFRHVHTTNIEAGFQEESGVGHLYWALPLSVAVPSMQYNSFVSALIVRRVAEAIGDDWHPIKCEFAHREFDCPEDAQALFGNRLEFDKPVNLFVLDGASLERHMPFSDAETFSVYRDLAVRWAQDLAKNEMPDVVVTLREHIVQLLSSGKVDLASVSTSIGVSPRSLQRRLEQAGTSFEKELVELRSGIARKLLTDTDRSVTEIAFDLGYSDPSVFTRAARRWFDMSPRDFRQSQRAGDSSAPVGD